MTELEGFSLSHIWVDPTEVEAPNQDTLQLLRQELPGDSASPLSGMRHALDAVLEKPELGEQAVLQITARSAEILLGATASHGAEKHYGIEGLLWAKALEPKDNGTFSALRVAAWARPGRDETRWSNHDIEDAMLITSLTDIDDPDDDESMFGLPLCRQTNLTILAGLVDMPSRITVGHVLDRRAVSQLDVPKKVKDRLLAAIADAYSTDSGEAVATNWSLEQDLPPGVRADQIHTATTHKGRNTLKIFPPTLLGHSAQTLGEEFSQLIQRQLTTHGLHPLEAKRLAAQLAVKGLNHFTNAAEFGYAERVLEEEAGLSPLPYSPKA